MYTFLCTAEHKYFEESLSTGRFGQPLTISIFYLFLLWKSVAAQSSQFTNFLQNIFLCSTKKCIEVWNNLRGSQWQNFHFWVNYPLNVSGQRDKMCGWVPRTMIENHCILGFITKIIIKLSQWLCNSIVIFTLWKCTSLSTASVGLILVFFLPGAGGRRCNSSRTEDMSLSQSEWVDV